MRCRFENQSIQPFQVGLVTQTSLQLTRSSVQVDSSGEDGQQIYVCMDWKVRREEEGEQVAFCSDQEDDEKRDGGFQESKVSQEVY